MSMRHRAVVAVLPFANLTADGEPDYFSRGFLEDLITDLSRFSDLSVLASESTAGDRANELSADYRVEGSLRREGEQLRVTAQLLDGKSRSVLWAERFERTSKGVFAIQDEITGRVVTAVSSRIQARLKAVAQRKPITERAAYDHWLHGMDCLKAGRLEADEQARQYFRQALELDPNFARAHLGLSLSHFNEWSCQLWQRWDENECMAYEHAERALALDADDHLAQLVLGRILLFRREFGRAEQHLERSLRLNQNDADCLVQAGMALAFLGRSEEGRQWYERALSLNPLHDSWYFAYGAVIAFAQKRYEDALECSRHNPPGIMVDMPALKAAAHYHLGRTEPARRNVELYVQQFTDKILRGRSSEPGEALRWLQHINPYQDAEVERCLVDGVRHAGLSGGALPELIAPSPDLCAFRPVGSLWQASFAGSTVWLPSLKGFGDLARLLSEPEREWHCAELMGSPASSSDSEAIDEKAKCAYRARIVEIEGEIDAAEANGDLGAAQRCKAELDALTEHLSAGLGLGGRARKLGAPTERARSAVTQRVKAAIRKVQSVHPVLGRHLSSAVRTGHFCSYRPTGRVSWQL